MHAAIPLQIGSFLFGTIRTEAFHLVVRFRIDWFRFFALNGTIIECLKSNLVAASEKKMDTIGLGTYLYAFWYNSACMFLSLP